MPVGHVTVVPATTCWTTTSSRAPVVVGRVIAVTLALRVRWITDPVTALPTSTGPLAGTLTGMYWLATLIWYGADALPVPLMMTPSPATIWQLQALPAHWHFGMVPP